MKQIIAVSFIVIFAIVSVLIGFGGPIMTWFVKQNLDAAFEPRSMEELTAFAIRSEKENLRQIGAPDIGFYVPAEEVVRGLGLVIDGLAETEVHGLTLSAPEGTLIDGAVQVSANFSGMIPEARLSLVGEVTAVLTPTLRGEEIALIVGVDHVSLSDITVAGFNLSALGAHSLVNTALSKLKSHINGAIETADLSWPLNLENRFPSQDIKLDPGAQFPVAGRTIQLSPPRQVGAAALITSAGIYAVSALEFQSDPKELILTHPEPTGDATFDALQSRFRDVWETAFGKLPSTQNIELRVSSNVFDRYLASILGPIGATDSQDQTSRVAIAENVRNLAAIERVDAAVGVSLEYITDAVTGPLSALNDNLPDGVEVVGAPKVFFADQAVYVEATVSATLINQVVVMGSLRLRAVPYLEKEHLVLIPQVEALDIAEIKVTGTSTPIGDVLPAINSLTAAVINRLNADVQPIHIALQVPNDALALPVSPVLPMDALLVPEFDRGAILIDDFGIRALIELRTSQTNYDAEPSATVHARPLPELFDDYRVSFEQAWVEASLRDLRTEGTPDPFVWISAAFVAEMLDQSGLPALPPSRGQLASIEDAERGLASLTSPNFAMHVPPTQFDALTKEVKDSLRAAVSGFPLPDNIAKVQLDAVDVAVAPQALLFNLTVTADARTLKGAVTATIRGLLAPAIDGTRLIVAPVATSIDIESLETADEIGTREIEAFVHVSQQVLNGAVETINGVAGRYAIDVVLPAFKPIKTKDIIKTNNHYSVSGPEIINLPSVTLMAAAILLDPESGISVIGRVAVSDPTPSAVKDPNRVVDRIQAASGAAVPSTAIQSTFVRYRASFQALSSSLLGDPSQGQAVTVAVEKDVVSDLVNRGLGILDLTLTYTGGRVSVPNVSKSVSLPTDFAPQCSDAPACWSNRSCSFEKKRDTRDCRACILRAPRIWVPNFPTGGSHRGGHCIQMGNDPVCQLAKEGQNRLYDLEHAGRVADCERIKLEQNTVCEARRAAHLVACNVLPGIEDLAREFGGIGRFTVDQASVDPSVSVRIEGLTISPSLDALTIRGEARGSATARARLAFVPHDIGHLGCPTTWRHNTGDITATLDPVNLAQIRISTKQAQPNQLAYTVAFPQLTGLLRPGPIESLIRRNPSLLVQCPVTGPVASLLTAGKIAKIRLPAAAELAINGGRIPPTAPPSIDGTIALNLEDVEMFDKNWSARLDLSGSVARIYAVQ